MFTYVCYFLAAIVAVHAQEACKAPLGSSGICVSMFSCKPFIKHYQWTKDPVQQAKILAAYSCGIQSNEPKICCPFKLVDPVVDVTLKNVEVPPPPDVSNNPNLKLLPENCGILDTESRIVNGNETGLLEFPWMARLRFNTLDDPDQFRCGGTILNNRYILTAAHCLKHNRFDVVGVRVGDHDYSTPVDCETDESGEKYCAPPFQDLTVEKFIPHPQFDYNTRVNDIALIRVKEPMDLSLENIRPVCLPLEKTKTYNFIGRNGEVTGWGYTEAKNYSSVLLKVNVPVVPLEECKQVYDKYAKLTYRQMCAGGKGKSDSCFGDSGGPLHVITSLGGDIRRVQQAVVSFGHVRKCGLRGWPGVYTRVAYYMDWILDNMEP